MQESQPAFLMLLMVSWGVTTTVLVILVIYRGTLSSKEDDQIFINAAEQHQYEEQQAVIAKMSRLTKPIIALAVSSGVLLLTSAGLWIYGGLKSF
jgi:beta-lactamase regulating signal transducer with metallopeptidase domain